MSCSRRYLRADRVDARKAATLLFHQSAKRHGFPFASLQLYGEVCQSDATDSCLEVSCRCKDTKLEYPPSRRPKNLFASKLSMLVAARVGYLAD